MFRKAVVFWAISIVMSLYTTLALTMLWKWFVAPVFRLSDLSFWVMYGLVLAVGLLRFSDNEETREAERRLVIMITAVEFCIPLEAREAAKSAVQDLMDRQMKGLWVEAGIPIVGRAFATTATLGVGFIVHVFVSA